MPYNWQTEYHRYRRYFLDLGRLYGKKKVRVYTEIIFSIVTTTLFLFFAIRPTLITIGGLMRKIKDQKAVTEQLQNKITALNMAQTEYSLVKDDLYLIDRFLPQDPHLSLLIKQLEFTAQQTAVTIETIKFDSVPLRGETLLTPTMLRSQNFNLVVSGQYQNLKSFLQACLLGRIILIESFTFKSGKTSQEPAAAGPLLTLSLNGQAYFLKED